MVYKSSAIASGSSGGTGGGGIQSINADTTPAQLIVQGAGISVSTSGGTTTITNTSAGSAGVSSIFGRTSVVAAQYGDYNFNLISGTAAVSQGGTGQTSLTAHSVLLGEGAVTGVGFATTGTAARILIDQGNADPVFKALTGDSSLSSTGAMVNLAVNSVAYPAAPATNTVPVVTSSNQITYEAVPNAALANSAITIGAQTGLAGGGTVSLGSAITLSMGTNAANTLAGYNSSGVFSDVAIGNNLSLSGGTLTATASGSVSSVFGRTGAVTAQWNDYQFNLIGGVASVSQGGTSLQTLTAHAVLLGEGTSAVSFATTGISPRLLIDQGSGNDPTFNALSGDITITKTGASSVLAIQGTSVTGTTGSGNVVFATAPTMTNPVVGTQATSDNSTKGASTAYVTTAVANAISGVNPAVAVFAATTQASDTSTLTYSNGVAGIGATLTGSVNTALTFDGQTITSLNQRVLVKNDTQAPSGAFNGIYYLTQLQTGILAPILTRALDYDAPSDINSTGAIPVVNGTVNANTSWLLTSTVNTVGTDALTYVKFTINPTTILTNTLTSAHIFVGNGLNVATDVAMTGDTSINSAGVVTVLSVHGVSYPASPSTNTVPVVTSSNVVTYETVPNAALANSAITIGAQTGLAGGGTVALGSAITLSMGTNAANTLAGYNNSGVFSDVSIGSNLTLVGGVLAATAGGGGAVSSVFGRTGAVVANWNDYQFNLIGGTASASQGGTGLSSLTAHAVMLGEGVSAVSFATTGTTGRILVDQGSGNDPTFTVVTGDASINSAGVITLATVNSNVGTYQGIAINGKGLNTSASHTGRKLFCRATTTGSNLTATYSNGASGVGATLTNSGTQAAFALDSITLNVADRTLVKDQSTTFQNGIYTVTNTGSVSTNWVLTRATDFDNSTAGNVTEGVDTVISEGTINAGAYYILTTSSSITLGTTALTFIANSAGLSLTSQNANLIFAGPSAGSAAQPSFRKLVSTDLPLGSIYAFSSGNFVM